MRPIKFRGWYKNEKLMFPIAEITFHKDGDVLAFPLTREAISSYLVGGNVVLMQSTGLLDKNGKEIYEGDIIEENIHFGHLMSYDFVPKNKEEKGSALYQVVRNQEKTKFELVYISHKKREPRTKILDIYNAHKIVGNIYENPELINR